MILKRALFLIFFILIVACNQVSFVYNDSKSLTNELFNKTNVIFTGENINSTKKYSSRYFGQLNENEFDLKINIAENKIKRSIQSNQAINKMDYELTFSYLLFNMLTKCYVLEKEIISTFSFVPKSSGFNFGSDQSLEYFYDLSVENNFQKFINLISEKDLSKCLDES